MRESGAAAARRQAKLKKYAQMHETWKQELLWWRALLTHWNGVAFIVPLHKLVPKHAAEFSPFTDASRSVKKLRGGAGAVFRNYYQLFRFTADEIRTLTIMDLEALTLILWLHTICTICPIRIYDSTISCTP